MAEIMNSDSNQWAHIHALAPIARKLIVLISVLSSLLLLLADIGIKEKWAFFQGPEILTLWYTGFIPVPLFLVLLLSTGVNRNLWIAGGGYSVILLLLAWYTGHATSPNVEYGNSDIFASYALSVGISTFILAPFTQALRSSGWPISYVSLYQHSWSNLLALTISAVFTIVVWLIFLLWSSLFKLIGIRFFQELFSSEVFAYPTTGFLFGLGMVLGRTQPNAARVILNICLTLGRVLYPLVAVLALLFLGALGLNSLEPLWKTGHATFLLDLLILVSIFLINSVYQDGESAKPYQRPLNVVANGALLSLPIFALIGFYAIHLRVEQYGWTQTRLWGSLITTYVTLYAFAYAASVVVRKERWLQLVAPANVAIAVFIAITLLLSQSPLLDFRVIAVRDHIRRTEDVTKLDLKYLRFDAGRPGYDALLALKSDQSVLKQPSVLSDIELTLNAVAKHQLTVPTSKPTKDAFNVIPKGTQIPDDLLLALSKSPFGDRRLTHGAAESLWDGCTLLSIAIGPKNENVWVFIDPKNAWRLPVYMKTDNNWMHVGQLTTTRLNSFKAKDISEETIHTLVPQWKDLQIEDIQYRFDPVR